MKRTSKIYLFVVALVAFVCCRATAQINIWDGVPRHKRVEMTPFLAPGSGNTAVVVCPGGSYFWHDITTEGYDVARWLQKNGISAFVLRYRTAMVPAFVTHFRYIFRGNRYPDPQEDLRRAILYIKARADIYGVDSRRIGAMGFSAGGHLVMSAAEFFGDDARPAFVAPIYPVVSMTDLCTHKRSRRALLGDNRKGNRELREKLSLEKHVQADCPPVFLVNCKDDPIVDWRNSVLLDSALTEKHVRHKYIQYHTGGHGFGASDTKGTAECRQWRTEFLKWMKVLKFL